MAAIPSGTVLQHFTCRDIGYGVEEGEVVLPPIGGPDWTGKRPYRRSDGELVYLFPDEIIEGTETYLCPHECPIVIFLEDVEYHQRWHETVT